MSAELFLYQEHAPRFAYSETLLMPEREASHNPIIAVTGVTSVGKDFLLAQLQKDTENQLPPILNTGTLLSEHFGLPRDEMRNKLTFMEIKEGQMAVTQKILETMPVILNTHVVFTHEGKLRSNTLLELTVNPLHYVVISGEPRQIITWREERNRKGKRKSTVESSEEISYHQEKIQEEVYALASVMGAGYSIVRNVPERTQENITFLQEILSTLR